MDKRRFFTAGLLILAAFIALVSAVFAGVFASLNHQEISRKADKLRREGLDLVFRSGLSESYRADRFKMETADLESGERADVWLFDPAGGIITGPEFPSTDPEQVRKVQRALLGDEILSVVYRQDRAGRFLALVVPVEQIGSSCHLILTVSLADMDAGYATAGRGAALSLAGLAAVLLALLLALGRALGRTAATASGIFKKLGDGLFTVRSPLEYRGLFHGLALDLNSMAEDLGKMFHAVSAGEEKARQALMSMGEGLLVTDTVGTVQLSNPAMEAITSGPVTPGTPWWQALRNPEIFSLVEEVRTGGRAGREIKINGKEYFCTGERLPDRDEFLFLFRDVALERNLENIKRELVAGVSHELKTPLTAIKGFTETLLGQEQDGGKRHHLEVIRRNTDRLISLVTDLLDLSRLEERPQELRLERVDLSGLVRGSVEGFRERAQKKNLEIGLELPESAVFVDADSHLLEQVVVNLVDNALRYTDSGGLTVAVRLEGPDAVLEVSDTGIGIPEDLQERIFERFFVVDRSRSRQTGGTGLGLSIVKHIVLLHKGRIVVRSRPGEGSVFTVSFPPSL